MEPDRTIDLPQGQVRYRDLGAGEAILFIHGLLVDGTLWRKVTPHLQDQYRCIVPDWPLGSHQVGLADAADRSPRGIANLIADFMAALELENVTVVANDTGGAIAQLLVTERPQRVGRLVLTPCDAYENFLPPAFRPLQWLARVPGALALALAPMRSAVLRRSPLGFGLLSKSVIPDEITARWVAPALSDRAIRRDVIGLLRGIDPRDTLAAAEKLRSFDRPTLIAWAPEDPFFKLRFAERLAQAIPDCRLELIYDSRTFVPEDQPERLGELIAEFAQSPTASTG
ncbi:MAG TPA: alpha/beta hydrolase [Solirubrobacteraceae bacterium]|jgi:pimeloyl-ACP methyl ester carboxylesterase